MHGYFKQRNIPFIDTQLSGDRGSHEGHFWSDPTLRGKIGGIPPKKNHSFVKSLDNK